ncbi:MAG: alpha/beta fold hydrolase, partial [Rhodocyclaceae bacterium]
MELVAERKPSEGISAQPIVFSATDGRALAAYRFDADGPAKGNVIIAAAMAVPQSFYAAFARHLASCGYTAWTFDYRGIGESLTGPLRHVRADLSDWLTKDYDALLLQVSETSPQFPVFVVGHSFGGQVAPLLPKGLAWTLNPGTDLVVEVHFVPSGKAETVTPSIGLFFAGEPPDRTPAMLRLGRQNIDIPAGEKA